MSMPHLCHLLIAALLWLPVSSLAQQAPELVKPTPADLRPKLEQGPIEKISATEYRIGEITINSKERSITFPARVNMQKGLLEYLLVQEAGKTHESLLKTPVQPYQLQIASLLINYQTTDRPLEYQGDPATPKGERVSVTITYPTDGATRTVTPGDWVLKRTASEEAPVELCWVFTGSVMQGGNLMAQLSGSLISLYHDPAALVDNSSVGGDSDRIWFANEKTVPAVGTPVRVTIKPFQAKKKG